MGGEEPENEKDHMEKNLLVLPSLVGLKLVDAPILFFVFSHKAFRKELGELHRVVVEAADNFNGSFDPGFLDNLYTRVQFFKFVYKYHSAAEDELIFTALDARVKNVVASYTMEHISIDDDFNSIFGCLDLLSQESEEKIPSLFQKVTFSIGTIQRTICQHMLKEEEQVFRLLIQQFTPEEQAKLLWQYICSVPAVVVEDFLPWMAHCLSADEQIDLLQCMKIVIPKEELFQEVVISWLENKQQFSLGPSNMYGKEAQFYGGEISFKEILNMYSGKFHFGEEQQPKQTYLTRGISRQNPFDSIQIWNTAIRRGLGKVQEELYEIRSSNNTSNLSSVVILLQFFLDVLICYSNVLDRIYYPVINELPKGAVSQSDKKLLNEIQVERLVKLLHSRLEDEAQLGDFVEGLYREVELLVKGVSTTLIFLETEVFPLISKNCSHEMQIWLLYTGLQTVPLGLLKWTVLWFSATLSEDRFKVILDGIKVESLMRKKYFSSLLREWLRTGYLGKTSTDNFTKDFQEGSSMGSQFLPEQMKEVLKLANLKSEMQAIELSKTIEPETTCAVSTKDGILNRSSSFSSTIEKLEASCSGKINVHMFFPGMRRNKVSVPKYPVKYGVGDTLTHELGLEDHLFFFHKALIKDLEHIVLLSSKLSKDIHLFPDFQRCFQQLQLLYDIHGETEDKVVFPYLESKGKLRNVTHSYSIDHKMESDHFKKISLILNKISKIHDDPERVGKRRTSYHHISLELHETCLSMKRIIIDHFNREEIDLGPLFGEHFSTEEQYKIIGAMLGRTRGETLQEMIPWLMSCLTHDEQLAILSLWRKVTKSTNFDEWLGEWWEDMKVYGRAKVEEGSSFPSSVAIDPLEIVSKYLGNDTSRIEGNLQHKGSELSEKQSDDYAYEQSQDSKSGQNCFDQQGLDKLSKEPKNGNCNENFNCIDQADGTNQKGGTLCDKAQSLVLSQKEMETAIRRISRDPTLDSQKKSHLIQSLLVSRWMATQQRSNLICAVTNGEEEDIGQYPSYPDSLKLTFGCKHYRRNCKILANCCNKLYTCIKCHDELTDHSIDRKSITKMMCMKCLIIQPIGSTCSNLSCNNFSMARYYCKICRLWDDERQIYHCPYCNICRVGKGLGIDYFHCMNCNACMSRSLSVHICREKCFEDNCPICHEYIFTSSAPVKQLPCGHLMHSVCFQEYTCGNYTCPICSKSLGDMQVYFQMLDALLAEEKIPEEYSGQTQVILCNDCERRGSASFHWLYHKCSHCASYNTRVF